MSTTITLTISDQDLDANQRRRLKQLLGAATQADLETKLGYLLAAAFDEFAHMILEEGIPSSIAQVKEHRLLNVIKRYYITRVPTEWEVSRLFKLKPTQAKNLIASVLTKYDHLLEQTFRDSLGQVLSKVRYHQPEHGPGEWLLELDSDHILQNLNQLIKRIAPKTALITTAQDSSATYRITNGAYQALCKDLGVQPKPQS